MATVALPSDLRNRIAAVAHRVRRLRFLRGLGLLTLALTLGFGAALLADYYLDLPSAVRIGVLCAWAGLGLAVFVFGLLRPLFRRFDAAAIAAAVEEQYPDLGERLTTSVELADAADEYHGSPELIAGVVRDADARSRRLNFLRAVSGKTAGRVGVAAAALLVLVLCPAVVRPGQYADLAQRFFRPWVTPPAFDIDAAPAQPFAARGRPLSLAAHLTPRRHVAAPDACTLVQIAADGKETRTPMPADKQGGYSATITPFADFRYRVEAGPDASATYPVETVQLVELGANSPEIIAKPPAYAQDTVDADIEDGLVDVTALQNGTLRFDCTFTRPAVAAYLDWIAAEGKADKGGAKTTTRELTLGADRQSGTVTLPAVASGKYQLRLVAEHGLENPFPEHEVVVRPDLPPQFTKTPAKEDLKAVLPYDRVPLEFAADDDVAVAGAEVEYRVNHQDPARDPLALTGQKTREATSKDAFALAGKVRPGDTVEYRIRISDNLPPEFGGPHVIYFPADRWLSLRIATANEIIALRDDINSKLEKIKEDLKAEIRGVYKTRSESRDRAALTPAQAKDVGRLENDNKDTENNLEDLAKAAEAAPSFQPLADLARQVAAGEMDKSEKSLDSAAADRKTPAERDSHFQESEKQLDAAYAKLDQMKRQNEELAQKALAQEDLAKLADKEQSLADKAAELAAKDPVKDPSAKNEAEQVKQQQQQNTDELRNLTEQNPELQKDLQEANAQQARDLAQRAQELAKQQQELADAEKRQNAERLADLARKQQELADKANALAKDTKEPTQAAKTNPLKPEDAQQAADALKQGDAQEALKHQDQEAHDLDRVADELTKAIDLAKDPQEAARQLARLEEGLKQKVEAEAKAPSAAKPLAERLKPVTQEQKAIDKAIERLSVPPANQAAQQDRKQARNQIAQVDPAVKDNNPWGVASQMEQAKQSLEKLANDLPSLEQRKAEALKEVAQLRKQQDEVAQKAQQAADQARNADPKDPRTKDQIAELMKDAARKQADVAEKLAKTDAPNQEARQERSEDALNQALRDLMDDRKEDLAASQADAKRQLERLEQALKGEKPADEKAAELAQKQHALADDAAKAANDPKATTEQKQALKQAQQQVAQEAKNLDASEAPQRKAEAADAAEKAAKAADANPATPEAQKQMQDAAKKLDDLAKQMQGRESEAARAQRLADRQAEAAAEAQRQPNAAPSEATRQKEQQVADEAKQLHAGAEAQAEKQRATDALQKAQEAAPQDQAKAQREAADALHDLADRLSGRKGDKADTQEATSAKPTDSPRQAAEQLAQKQRQLAQQTQQAQDKQNQKPGEAGKQAMQDALAKEAQKQQELGEDASHLSAGQQQKALEQAREAMNQAQQALERNQPDQAKQKQNEAADALQRLAQQMPAKAPESGQRAQAGDAQPPQGLPNKEQAGQARDLAKQQRDLADEVRRATDEARAQASEAPKDNPLGELTKQQQEVARQAEQMAQQANRQQGKDTPAAHDAGQAHQAARQAADRLQAGEARQARQSGQQAAQQMRELAKQLAQAPGDVHAPAQAQQAQQLAEKQEEINRKLDPLAQDPAAERAQQQAQQQSLQQQTGELTQDLNKLTQQLNQAHQGQQANQAQQAANSGQQAQNAQQQAQQQARQGDQGGEHQSHLQAAQSLQQAAQQIAQAGQQPGQPTAQQGQQQTGQALQQAQNAMQQAQGKMQQGQPQGAQQAMAQAAQSLAQAAQQAAQQGQPQGQPGDPNSSRFSDKGAQAGGTPDASLFTPELKRYAGKTWGELPGELRTKIVQQAKVKYGDDYARMIKLYFEQAADGRNRK